MAYIVTKLITSPEGQDFYLIGSFSNMKQAAAAATNEYKEYNKVASFVNLEMVNEWLSTRGEYSFRQDKANRIQLDISIAEEDKPIVPEHQKIFSYHAEDDSKLIQISQSMVPDGTVEASK